MVNGTVKWYNEKKGYGFIAQDDGDDVFAHVSALRDSGLHDLEEGQRVSFEIEDGKKGKSAVRIRPID